MMSNQPSNHVKFHRSRLGSAKLKNSVAFRAGLEEFAFAMVKVKFGSGCSPFASEPF